LAYLGCISTNISRRHFERQPLRASTRDSDFSQWDAEDLKKELGDSLWYIAVIASFFDIPLDDVAQLNIAKLADRQRRGVIGGSGDGR
jgi:NTP pyrophosphatase (non-canonical NTP hydrolase)